MHVYIRTCSKKSESEITSEKKERGRERKRKRLYECVRVDNAHYAFLRALLHLNVLHRLSFCFFVCLSSPLFSIINFPLRSSLSPHFTNSLKRTFRILLVRPLFFFRPIDTAHLRHPIIAQKQQ